MYAPSGEIAVAARSDAIQSLTGHDFTIQGSSTLPTTGPAGAHPATNEAEATAKAAIATMAVVVVSIDRAGLRGLREPSDRRLTSNARLNKEGIPSQDLDTIIPGESAVKALGVVRLSRRISLRLRSMGWEETRRA